MKKWLISIALFIIVGIAIVFGSITYFNFISETIYLESVSHLNEIYNQTNSTLNTVVATKWNNLHLWAHYLSDVEDEEKINNYLINAKNEIGFTNFYFISKDSDYLTMDDKVGYIDLSDNIINLFFDKQDVLIRTVVPGESQFMLFVIPIETNTYKNFEYEAIGFSFNDSDFINMIDVSAFSGYAKSFLVHNDGRVIISNDLASEKTIYNLMAYLNSYSSLSEEEISSIRNDLNNRISGSKKVKIETDYYFIYLPTEIEDWFLVGLVPSNIVNNSMNRLQRNTIILVASISITVGILLIALIVLVTRNTLKKKNTEIKFRDELFNQISTRVDDVFMMLDSETMRVDYISPNVEKLLGIKEDKLRMNVYELNSLLNDCNIVNILELITSLNPGEQNEWYREYIHKRTKEPRWFYVVGLCSQIEEKKKYILVFSDRTNDKILNEQLKEAVKIAESANKAKNFFLSNMSHDIRTPMNAIVGFAALAKSNIDNRDKIENYLEKILSSSNHLLSLVNDILDMSRIENGKLNITENEESLVDIFVEIGNILGGSIHNKNLKLYFDTFNVIDENIYCDRTHLNQILINIISNAIKFTNENGSIRIKVSEIRKEDNKGVYEFRIKDNGIGMSKDFVKRLFKPFEREKTSTVSKIQGTGLGMAIVKNIVDLMGGTISVATEEGIGTEIVVTLEFKLSNSLVTECNSKYNKVLILCNDEEYCINFSSMLKNMNINSFYVTNCKDFLNEINDSYDFIYIDEMILETSKAEMKNICKAINNNAKIIVGVYSYSNIDSILECDKPVLCPKPLWRSRVIKELNNSKIENSNDKEIKEINYHGCKILLVEDNSLNSEIAYDILSSYGIDVTIADDGTVALDIISKAKSKAFDLILMDIQMPKMNGYEATKRIRALKNNKINSIPIIAMTANAFDEDKNEALSSGMNDFITKPIRIKEIIDILNKYLK